VMWPGYVPLAIFLFVLVYYLRQGPKIHRNGEDLRCVS
jgi:hypothetical protein